MKRWELVVAVLFIVAWLGFMWVVVLPRIRL
jgi:hypothetical protein